ncbi:MAG: hypothetical protein AAGA66_13580 [Bacteroidota bacterium]
MTYWIGNIIFILLLSYFLHRHVFSDLNALVYWSALGYKLSAGIVLGLVFMYEYGSSDSFTYFKFGKEILSGGHIAINQPRVTFFSTCLVPLIWVTGGSYWLTGLYLSCISFYSYCYFVGRFNRLFPGKELIVTGIFLFMPTVTFWSSGVLKGTLTNASLVFLVSITLSIYQKRKINGAQIILALGSLVLLFNIKHYLLIAYVSFIGGLTAICLTRRMGKLTRWPMAVGIVCLTLFLVQNIHPYLTLGRLSQTIYENNQAILKNTESEKRVDLEIAKPDVSSVIRVIPKSIYTGLFRPAIHEKVSPWGLLHQIENFLLATLTIFTVLLVLKDKAKIDWQLIGPAAFSILLLASLLAMTTPNFGSLVRYRNAFLPFLFLMVSILPFQYLLHKPLDNH